MATKRLLLLAAAALAASGAARAQDDPSLRVVTIGLGVQDVPRYPGAMTRKTGALPQFEISRPGDPLRFKAADQGVGFGFLGRNSAIDFGPAVQWKYSRRSGRDVPAGVPSVGFTVEAGGFVQAMLGNAVRVRAEGRQGIGGHEGFVLDLSADAVLHDGGDTTLFSIGPRLRLSDGRYQRAYFGVSPAAAAATGLPVFRPDTGIYAAGVASTVRHRMGSHWGVYAFAAYDRLIDDAGRSPLVRLYGRRNEVSGGIALTYGFSAHLPGL
jgi:outer membrane protein